MAQIKGAPVSHQEVQSNKSHFISLFISTASEDTAEAGQDCSQLSQTPKVSQQGTKPTEMCGVSDLMPSLPCPCETQNSPQETDWTKVPLAHPGTEEFCIPASILG